jgi:hypothetical protein
MCDPTFKFTPQQDADSICRPRVEVGKDRAPTRFAGGGRSRRRFFGPAEACTRRSMRRGAPDFTTALGQATPPSPRARAQLHANSPPFVNQAQRCSRGCLPRDLFAGAGFFLAARGISLRRCLRRASGSLSAPLCEWRSTSRVRAPADRGGARRRGARIEWIDSAHLPRTPFARRHDPLASLTFHCHLGAQDAGPGNAMAQEVGLADGRCRGRLHCCLPARDGSADPSCVERGLRPNGSVGLVDDDLSVRHLRRILEDPVERNWPHGENSVRLSSVASHALRRVRRILELQPESWLQGQLKQSYRFSRRGSAQTRRAEESIPNANRPPDAFGSFN